MLLFFLVLSLLLPLNLSAAPPAEEFRIGEYRALSLLGEARILPDAEYVSFTGDYGFRRLPSKDAIERHTAQESALLANFQLRVINLEFMLPGISGREQDGEIDKSTIDLMKRTGYDLVSRANNHAMDYGPAGVAYNTRLLQKAGFKMIGTRNFPVFNWKAAGRDIAIFSLTDYTDRPDPEGLILKIDEADLQVIKKVSSGADFRIAFVHLGSMSFYPSPHEREKVKRILDAGVNLVVCTGSHFIKGFVYENQKPVVYGIGNYIFSDVDKDTEPVGMHFVAGFNERDLVQLFIVPFHNTIMQGTSGPLDEAEFAFFQRTLLDRSTYDSNRYYSDPSSITRLQERLSRFDFADINRLRGRHILYVAGILYYHYPVTVIGSAVITLALAVLIGRWTVHRKH